MSLRGPLLLMDAAWNLWGGLEPATGRVIDPSHPQHGALVAGRILAMPGTRGSSAGTGVLVETIRLGNGPVAVLLPGPDQQITVAGILAEELYGVKLPVIVLPDRYAQLRDGEEVSIGADGTVTPGEESR